jgi:xanthine dehydrogenase accessory factor
MSDNHLNILHELMAAQEAGQSVALATIVKARGSVPRHAGTKMLIYANGRSTGTIGGGEMESRVVEAAVQAIKDQRPLTLPYSLVSPERGDPGVCGGDLEIYIEPYLPPETLFIIGCGHVGRALAYVGQWLGYRVVVTDDREALVSPELIPGADVYLPGAFADALQAHPIHARTYVAVVTRNIMVDKEVLPQLLPTDAPYIGVMGSRRRWEETKALLFADGVEASALERIVSPIGIELQAETPEEIAISILSQITLQRRSVVNSN